MLGIAVHTKSASKAQMFAPLRANLKNVPVFFSPTETFAYPPRRCALS
jgi:hypothetical protein